MKFNNKKTVKYIIIALSLMAIAIVIILPIVTQIEKNKNEEAEKLAQINYRTKTIPKYAASIINYCSNDTTNDFFRCIVSEFSNYSFKNKNLSSETEFVEVVFPDESQADNWTNFAASNLKGNKEFPAYYVYMIDKYLYDQNTQVIEIKEKRDYKPKLADEIALCKDERYGSDDNCDEPYQSLNYKIAVGTFPKSLFTISLNCKKHFFWGTGMSVYECIDKERQNINLEPIFQEGEIIYDVYKLYKEALNDENFINYSAEEDDYSSKYTSTVDELFKKIKL